MDTIASMVPPSHAPWHNRIATVFPTGSAATGLLLIFHHTRCAGWLAAWRIPAVAVAGAHPVAREAGGGDRAPTPPSPRPAIRMTQHECSLPPPGADQGRRQFLRTLP